MSNLALQQNYEYRVVKDSLDWLEFLHKDTNSDFYIPVERIRDKSYAYLIKRADLSADKLLEATKGELGDIYQTINPMYSFNKRRCAENTANLQWLWCDLDLKSDDEIYQALLEFEGMGLPLPTVRLYSGRGVWLMWRLSKAELSASPKSPSCVEWSRLQTAISTKLAHLQADISAIDKSRLCRLVGSVNSKSGKTVWAEVVDNLEYTLEDFGRAFPKPEKKKSTKNSPADSKAKEKPRGKLRYMFNEFTMHRSRAQDVMKLIQMRDGKMGGQRDKALFIFGSSLLKATDGDEEKLRIALNSMNDLFDDPLNEKEVKNIVTGLCRYEEEFRWKNSTVIEWLNITDNEQHELSFVISKDEKRRRDKLKKREIRGGGSRAEYQAKRLSEQMEKAKKVREFIKKHPQATNSEIARVTGMSLSAVKRAKSSLQN